MNDVLLTKHTTYEAAPGAVYHHCLELFFEKAKTVRRGQSISMIHNSTELTFSVEGAQDDF